MSIEVKKQGYIKQDQIVSSGHLLGLLGLEGFGGWLQLVHCAYILTSLSIVYRAESQSPMSSKIGGTMEFMFGVKSEV